MNQEEGLKAIVCYWTEKAFESLQAAGDERKAGRLSFSVNRAYYACFYMVSALLLQGKLRFQKHSGVRAAFHQHFVKTGLVSRENGLLYDELFEARQRGDYLELVRFDENQVADWIARAGNFMEAVRKLIEQH